MERDSETATGLLVRSPVGRNSGTPRIAPYFLAKLVLGAPTGNAKHQLGLWVGCFLLVILKAAFPRWSVRRYTQDPANKKTVIPAGMPESSAMDGNLSVVQVLDLRNVPARRFTSMWLDSGIPAGMTASQQLCITTSAGAWEG